MGRALDSILVPEGATVAVGEPIATLANGDGAAGQEAQRRTRSPSGCLASAAIRPAEAQRAPDDSAPERPVATPVARRTAVELGVSLHGLTGTGPGGRITVDDVTRAAAEDNECGSAGGNRQGRGHGARADSHASDDRAPDGRVGDDDPGLHGLGRRRRVADRRDAPRGARQGRGGAVGQRLRRQGRRCPLREFPRFNASYVDGKVELYSRVNVGIAVATDDALLVPVVRDADRKSLAELAEETRTLVDGARRRALRPEDFHDGTFTVSNLGMFGVRAFTAIVDPPQVAILAVGGARRAPVRMGPTALLSATC